MFSIAPQSLYSNPSTILYQQVMGPEDSTNTSIKGKSYLIPRLTANRSNWVTWKQQTLSSLMSNKGIQRHIEETAQLPPAIPEYPDGHTLLTDEVDQLEKMEEKWDVYNQREATIKAQILTTIPETLAIEVQSLETGKEIWDVLLFEK